MERIFRAAALAGLATLTACGTVEAYRGNDSPMPSVPVSGVDAPDRMTASDEIRALLPPDASVLAMSEGDIDANGRPDLVVAVDITSDEASGDPSPRSLLLFLRTADGHLELAARNDRIVPCATCGGSLGAPSIQLEAGSGVFKLRTEGGTGWLWSNEYSFTHKGNSRWQLASVVRMATHRVSHETTMSELAAADFGVVDFLEFDPETIEDAVRHQE